MASSTDIVTADLHSDRAATRARFRLWLCAGIIMFTLALTLFSAFAGSLRSAHIHLDVQSMRQRLVSQVHCPTEIGFPRWGKMLMRREPVGRRRLPCLHFTESVVDRPGAALRRFAVVLPG